ncbi:DUF6287 domain-containing protein [Fructobacillus papyrifericola]|uniref:DUF3237 domain-containing protein n=1 Tax=Fructobacillus papyrifericola TaxID=2713172 RepID=A0ABS5QUE0_9LACO|nr:DUF6287 domain-containing protein [Fructobacillus papyrifericola]MBS9336808.1 DUF3237 domain-containing protein [Fructobacillus papyrifericola]
MLTKASKIAIAAVGAVVVIGGASFGYAAGQSHHNGNKTTATVTKTKKSATSDKKATGMDLTAISKGDFSSVEGTWKNSKGDSFTFDKNGLVSATYSGQTTTDQMVYIKSVGSIHGAEEKDGMLKSFIGPKNTDDIGPSGAVDTYFIPKGTKLEGTTNDSVDRIYYGQQVSDDAVFYKQSQADAAQAASVDKLSTKEKQALVLLGMPDKFHSDYGETNVDMMLSGKLHTTIMKMNFEDVDSTFNGVKIVPNDGHPDEQVLRLQNVPQDIQDNNRADTMGVYTIDGDTVTYRVEGTRTGGESEEIRKGKVVGTASLSALYKQYKNSDKLKQMEAIIED